MILKVKTLKSFREKIKGLMFSNKAYPVLIEARFGIHTFFLKFPIDVLILDKSNKVVRIKKLKPNRILIWNPKYAQVIELPSGRITEKQIKIGDLVTIQESGF